MARPSVCETVRCILLRVIDCHCCLAIFGVAWKQARESLRWCHYLHSQNPRARAPGFVPAPLCKRCAVLRGASSTGSEQSQISQDVEVGRQGGVETAIVSTKNVRRSREFVPHSQVYVTVTLYFLESIQKTTWLTLHAVRPLYIREY